MTVSLNYLPWVAGLRAESQNHHHQFHAALVNRSSRLYRTPPHSTNLLKKTEAFVSFKLFLTFTAQRKLRDANKLLQILSLQREAVTEETAAPSFQAASQGRAPSCLAFLPCWELACSSIALSEVPFQELSIKTQHVPPVLLQRQNSTSQKHSLTGRQICLLTLLLQKRSAWVSLLCEHLQFGSPLGKSGLKN